MDERYKKKFKEAQIENKYKKILHTTRKLWK